MGISTKRVFAFGLFLVSLLGISCNSNAMSPYVWSEHSALKCNEQYLPPTNTKRDATVHMRVNAVRNEWETAQLLVRSDEQPLKNLRIKIGSLTCGTRHIASQNVEVRSAYYVAFKRKDASTQEFVKGTTPDPLVPFETSMTLPANRTQAFYIQVHVPRTAYPGKYSAPVTLLWDGGQQTHYLDVHVWDVTLPDKPQVVTAFGLARDMTVKMHGVESNEDEAQRLTEKYYEMMLDYGLSAYELPVAFDSPKAKKYLDDPRVTSYLIPGADWKTTDSLSKTIDLLKRKNWWKRAYVYPVDEPVTTQSYAKLRACVERLRTLAPDIRAVSPFFCKPADQPGKTYMDLVGDLVKIHCCCTGYYDEDTTVAHQMTQMAKTGRGEPWWYVCCNPREPYANLFVSQQGMEHRILPWQMKQHDILGLLYWRVNHWTLDDKGTTDPWHDMATVKDIDPNLYGDGSLFYPGNKVGIDGPVPSVRMVNLRDGLEDYGLLDLYEKRFGRKATKTLISKLSKSLKDYSHNPEELESVRVDILEQLTK